MMPIRAMRSPLSRKFAIIIAYFFAGSKQNREIRWTSGANRRTMGLGIYDCTLSSHFSSVTSSSKPMPARTSSCTSSGKSLSGTPSSRTSASASP